MHETPFWVFFSKTILQSLEWKIQRDLYITLSAMHACYNPTKPTRVTIKKAGSKSAAAARGKKASGWVDGGVEWSLRWRRLREWCWVESINHYCWLYFHSRIFNRFIWTLPPFIHSSLLTWHLHHLCGFGSTWIIFPSISADHILSSPLFGKRRPWLKYFRINK